MSKKKQNQEDDFNFVDDLPEMPTEDELEPDKPLFGEPETPTVDDFDLEALILNHEAVFDESVRFVSQKTGRVEVMPIKIIAVSHSDWNRTTRKATRKGSDDNVEELIVAKGWVQTEEPLELVPLSKIRQMPRGIVSQVFDKIKIVSGQFDDRLEDKLIDKLTDF